MCESGWGVSDRAVVVMAITALGGAWVSWSPPLVAVLVLVAVALAVRRPVLLVVAVAASASFLGARSWDGIRSAPTSGRVDSAATVVADPEWVLGAVRTELRLADDGRRVQVLARGDAASVLASRLAGERVQVEGRLRPVSRGGRDHLARRHVGSRLIADVVSDPRPGGAVTRFTNQLRRTLVDGTDSMSRERRALFTGLVLGDDREQEAEEVDDFRASGLTHLLAVSGQNVAFVLAIAAPLLRRLSRRGRFISAAAILVTFGILTRWEPSVLRAVAMAALALLASTIGRPATSIRVLALAVTALVLVDPMLSGSIGFLLSIGACTGIASIGPLLERRGVPTALAVTVAAQVGVAPVLLPVFGGIPLASLPANLLAGPAAGPVMMWGLIGGLPAGLLGGRVAELLHLPTRLLLAWIAGVARVSARLPLPEIGLRAAAALGALAVAVLITRRLGRGIAPQTAVGGLVIGAVLLVTVLRPAQAPAAASGVPLVRGADLWRRDGAVVVVLAGNVEGGRLLEALRRNRIRRIDVLVLRSGGGASARLSQLVRHRSDVRLALAPAGHTVPGAAAFVPGQAVRVRGLEVVAVGGGTRLDVRVGSPPPCVSPSGPATTTCRPAPS